MKFLEARQIVQSFGGGEPLPLLLALSGLGDPLALYLEAAGARAGRSVTSRFLPFATLRQHLFGEPPSQTREVLLLLPWDFVPATDWRSGVPAETPGAEAIAAEIAEVGRRIAHRPNTTSLYLPAPASPLWLDPVKNAALAARIEAEALSAGAQLLSAEAFSLASYLASGCPIGGAHLGVVAIAVIDAALATRGTSKKVLVTDCDNVLWGGVVAEEGPRGIAIGPEGAGYRHFIYQSLLQRLRNDGVILAAVTRNDPDIVAEAFREGRMPLAESDFVAVLASYAAKSAQISRLAESLNLGLESFVFVDDNPVELAEVAAALPQITIRTFPNRDEGIPELFRELAADFRRDAITAEDRGRTEMYRRRLESMAPSDAAGADLTAFLRDLNMTLTIRDRSSGDRVRAVQLINKTNQFNLNGHRVQDADLASVLAAGGRLYGASLSDRTGSHGEILACLVDASGVMRAFVMSCRVFQRRVEHAFLAWLCAQADPPTTLDYAETPRNEPFRIFLGDPAFTRSGEAVTLDPGAFRVDHREALELFTLRPPEIPT